MYAAEMLNVLDLGREIKSIAISIASLEEGFYILTKFIYYSCSHTNGDEK